MSLFTSTHFRVEFAHGMKGRYQGGINKCASHTSPVDIHKKLQLWVAVGVSLKTTETKRPFYLVFSTIVTQSAVLTSLFPVRRIHCLNTCHDVLVVENMLSNDATAVVAATA